MKNVKQRLMILFSLFPLLLSCSSQMEGRSADGEGYAAVENGEMETNFEINVPPGTDSGLYLYRNATTRLSVVEFYTSVTGDPRVGRAILKAAAANDIPLSLAFSLAFAESDYDNLAVNTNPDSVDRGLFQLNSETFPELTEREFFDPEINAAYGLRFFRWCLNKGDNEVVAIAFYNAGLSRVEFNGAPRTTLDHINNIMNYRERLEASFIAHMMAEPSLRIGFGEPDSPRELNLL